MRLGGEDRVDVGLVESVVLHALEEEANGRGISDVQGRRGASTAGEETTDTSEAVDDDRTRVALFREGAGLGVEREDSPFFGGLGFVIVVVDTGVGANVVGTADGQAGGATALDHHKARVIVLVECGWVTHLLVRNGALEPQKTVERIQEGMEILGAHHTSELADWDAGTEVDGIAVEIARVDLGGVDLDDGPVLGIILAAAADSNGRREDDMAQNAALRGGPVSRNILVEGLELFHPLPHLVQPGLG